MMAAMLAFTTSLHARDEQARHGASVASMARAKQLDKGRPSTPAELPLDRTYA
jgi:hypothetical protein